jgi:hypothetical protein
MASGVVCQSISRIGRSEPFELQVARGQITGHKVALVSGVASSVGTSFVTVWNQNTVYSYLSSATTLTVSSSNANDTSAGTGARTLAIFGLDGNYNEINETITLNGQTAVTTVNSYLRVFHLEVLTAGSGGAASGTIYAGTGTVTAGVPANIYSTYTTGAGATACIWTVPAGYTGFLNTYSSGYGITTANAYGNVSVCVRPFGSVFDTALQGRVSNGTELVVSYPYPLVIPEKSDIEIRAFSSTAGANVTAEFQIVYILNDGAL